MAAALVHLGATVLCAHGGQATPTAPNPRVLVSSQPVTTTAPPYVVAGCPFVPPAAGPCVTAQWLVGAIRVLVGGIPAVLATGTSHLRADRDTDDGRRDPGPGDGHLMQIDHPIHVDGRGRTAQTIRRRPRPRPHRAGAVHRARASG